MTWETTGDVHEFVAAAGRFLESQPVENTVLLTEAAYLAARSSGSVDQPYGQHHGWWRDADGRVDGAFLQAPRHPPVLSLMPVAALAELAEVLPTPAAVGVDARQVDDVVRAWSRAGTRLRTRSRIGLHRLAAPARAAYPRGRARTAVAADRDLLVTWFDRLMADHPDDPSDRAYVIDDPLEHGGITLWEVDDVPVAMAGRSRVVARMARLGAVFEEEPGSGHGKAALAASCAAALPLTEHVLLFVACDDPGGAALAADLGFVHVLDRVMLSRS